METKMETTCLICNIRICNKYYLKKHLLKFHNITVEEYNIKYNLVEPVIDRLCKYCGADINDRHYNAEFCDKKCRKLFYNQEDNEKRAKDINNTLECKICGYKTSGSMMNHLRHRHNLTVDEYKEKYNVSHEECYSECYLNTLSEKIKGEKNPAYQHGGKFSPFSTKFIKYENTEDVDVKIKAAKKKAKNSTGSVSKAEQILFEELNFDNTLEQQMIISANSRNYLYDIYNLKNKRIVEYNGDWWHCNPKIYSGDYFHPILKKTAKEVWERDALKIQAAVNLGFEVLIIWEQEYNSNKKDVLEKCNRFLRQI